MVGLIEPEIARAAAAGNSMYWRETHEPEYVIRRLIYREQLEPEFYHLVKTFNNPKYPKYAVGVFARLPDSAAGKTQSLAAAETSE